MTSTPSAEMAIEAGRAQYASKRYKSALEQFTKAMKACPCARGVRRERCHCKNFEAVAEQNGSIFNEAMYNCTCAVGKTFSKCSNGLHVQALDYRAATFEAMNELDRARKDAEWILDLAPRLPDGYLRLGKIARLQKKHEYAWKLYCAGIDACGDGVSSAKIQQLYAARKPLQVKFMRKDPMYLPHELIQWILSLLDFASLVRCLRVCKAWRQMLTARGHEWLWRTLSFTGSFSSQYAPSISSLQKLLSYSKLDAKEIIIKDGVRFKLNTAKFTTLLRGARKLQRLEIHGGVDLLEKPKGAYTCPNLKSLQIDGYTNKVMETRNLSTVPFPYWMIAAAAGNLTDLHCSDVPLMWLEARELSSSMPTLSKLKHLRLESEISWMPCISLAVLSHKTPALEHLWLKGLTLGLNDTYPEEGYNEILWKSLRSLVVKDTSPRGKQSLVGISHLVALGGGRNLQLIDLELSSGIDARSMDGRRQVEKVSDILGAPFWFHTSGSDEEGWSVVPNDYSNLRHLRCRGLSLEHLTVQTVFEGPVTTGKLESFDIYFPLEGSSHIPGQQSVSYLKEHEWLRGAQMIRSLGIFGFRFCEYPRNDEEMPLPKFIASFPNLEELEIASDGYEAPEFCTVLGAILKGGSTLKRIYQKNVQGVRMDQLAQLAKTHGVSLIWGPRPQPWPAEVS